MAIVKCKICGKDIKRYTRELKKNKAHLCSIKCRGEYYKGENNPHWRGGRPHFNEGRYLVYAPGHPGANLCKGTYILEYRLIAEQITGRPLFPHEIVHHKNGDITDNRIENLEIITQSEHIKTHLPEMHRIRAEKGNINGRRKKDISK